MSARIPQIRRDEGEFQIAEPKTGQYSRFFVTIELSSLETPWIPVPLRSSEPD